jgi:hypothetical protein
MLVFFRAVTVCERDPYLGMCQCCFWTLHEGPSHCEKPPTHVEPFADPFPGRRSIRECKETLETRRGAEVVYAYSWLRCWSLQSAGIF